MNISFEGKRILVTGAGQGIGRKLALHLSKYGGQVIALSKTQKNLENLREEDSRIQIICVDLNDWNNSRKAVESILPIDLLVNNAGVARLNSFFDVTPEDFDLTFAVNVRAIVNISQIVAKNMVERKVAGSIVNLSSQASQAALKDHSVYCASKGAVDMLSKTMALELGPHNIRVNTINPTVIMTEMGKLGWKEPEKARTMLSKIPLGRFGEVSEVIDAIVFLLSDHSSMINGVTLPVDGGFLAT
ncbi:L-xylulose reductase [Eufriesea mexicana]|uniref:L-xylulose reductase n=1 Tax=Eufriesea mexicana TaxID=516756 RepID=UPI00083BC668|nr:PREDICTED: L-xylulose reductase [Eufriesea mexicana]XP_017757001.1 PREDICTED: L-xylulose reductase [Eufriesea mexicana]OAD57211.1 L-xylulose reductase [Eufriesea mexicana]